ncbi:gamma-glutamyl-gamma-aminobutyrate hydrolase family protein [Desulfovibrio sp.]|uniref:glutamine amidotransferase-related protein n=1 Tax=Desulfovibrio sp. TaxID=885 RepID=UPI00307C045E
MRCCVLQHLAFEDLGTFAPVLLETGWTIQACHVADGLPDARDWRDADLCIVLGGPMGVHDGAAYPFLSRELELVRSRLGEGRPLLGICLGAQLMAQALGAAVYAGKAKEIGWDGPCWASAWAPSSWHRPWARRSMRARPRRSAGAACS